MLGFLDFVRGEVISAIDCLGESLGGGDSEIGIFKSLVFISFGLKPRIHCCTPYACIRSYLAWSSLKIPAL